MATAGLSLCVRRHRSRLCGSRAGSIAFKPGVARAKPMSSPRSREKDAFDGLSGGHSLMPRKGVASRCGT